jgi:hypothetical protein
VAQIKSAFFLILFALFFSSLLPSHALSGLSENNKDKLRVTFKNGLVEIEAKDAKLSEVLQALGKEVGFKANIFEECCRRHQRKTNDLVFQYNMLVKPLGSFVDNPVSILLMA